MGLANLNTLAKKIFLVQLKRVLVTLPWTPLVMTSMSSFKEILQSK
jgi:hypothetical protein